MKKCNKKSESLRPGQYVSAMLLLSVCLNAQAELIVAGDYGGQPASPFYDAINNAQNEWDSRQNTPLTLPAEVSPAMVLPVRTPEMTPKLFESRQVTLPGIGALYLIGDDPLSREWLESHAEKLNAMNAVGMVVNVESDVALQELRQLAQGGLLSPMPGTDLATRLQLSHYPVLITEHELTQQVK
ncbi:integrating conjugative element protein [Providencia rettgeri]|uniref:integrating conjugative element protein n=1 Tax=Providencia rettgeri TaxID=587 RepID=UPI0024AA0733